MLKETRRVRRPVDFHLSREMRNGVELYARARNAKFFCFNECCARATKGVQHTLMAAQPESTQVVAHQVRRKREHKAVPVVDGPIL